MSLIDAGSYEEYRESTRRQEKRDHDRFTEVDMTTAPTRHMLPASVFDRMDMWAAHYSQLGHQVEGITAIIDRLRTAFVAISDYDTIYAAEIDKLLVKQPKHTYPRKHGEWWNRRR